MGCKQGRTERDRNQADIHWAGNRSAYNQVGIDTVSTGLVSTGPAHNQVGIDLAHKVAAHIDLVSNRQDTDSFGHPQ